MKIQASFVSSQLSFIYIQEIVFAYFLEILDSDGYIFERLHNLLFLFHLIFVNIPNRVVEICSDEENFLAT